MTRAIIFDLDGTLVRTEDLKACAYARAAALLGGRGIEESQVVEHYKELVGLSRQVVSEGIVARFGLNDVARRKMGEYGVDAPWEVLARIRLDIYDQYLQDRQALQEYECPYNVGLLRWAGENDYRRALATMSHRDQAMRMLELLGIQSEFDFIATRDDVVRSKPDPEIYQCVARNIGVDPGECLVIEDSPAGITAALQAGMSCVAVTTGMTRTSVHASKLLDERWIVDDPVDLLRIVQRALIVRRDVLE